jgi:ubiquinone/menaquinone biosynthesis C-methylase UbiE
MESNSHSTAASTATKEPRRAFFNARAELWDDPQRERQMQDGLAKFIESSCVADPRCILDVGCGTGVLVPHLLTAYPRAQVVVELDFAEEMLARNRSRFTDARLVRLVGDATDLLLPDDSVDLIVCFNSAPHLGQDEAAFRDLFRVLVPGGAIAVGHLKCSRELNRVHGRHAAPIAQDHLPLAPDLAAIFARLGGVDVVAEEYPGWYFVRANKPV